jgi:hypothetical protein
MKTKAAITLLLSIFTTMSMAQKFEVAGSMIYGTYSMKEVSSFQQEIIDQLLVPAKVMSDFPAYIGWEGKISYCLPNVSLGLYSSMHSTGSRVSYLDYSGSFEYNQHAKTTQLGLGIEYFLSPRSNDWQSFLYMQIGLGWTKFNLNDEMIIDGQMIFEDNIDFTSNHITLQPGIGVRRNLGKYFVSTQLGYILDGAKTLEDDRGFKLLNNKGEPIGVDWSGVRLALTCGIKF